MYLPLYSSVFVLEASELHLKGFPAISLILTPNLKKEFVLNFKSLPWHMLFHVVIQLQFMRVQDVCTPQLSCILLIVRLHLQSSHLVSSTFCLSSRVLGTEGYKKWKTSFLTRRHTLGNLSDSDQLSGNTQTQYRKSHPAGKSGYTQRIRAFIQAGLARENLLEQGPLPRG